jgi:hypothetical protein
MLGLYLGSDIISKVHGRYQSENNGFTCFP